MPLGSFLELSETVLEVLETRLVSHRSRGDPGAEDTAVFEGDNVVLAPGGRTTGWGEPRILSS